jgi:hypothetical protein
MLGPIPTTGNQNKPGSDGDKLIKVTELPPDLTSDPGTPSRPSNPPGEFQPDGPDGDFPDTEINDNDLISVDDEKCYNNFDITHIIPKWILERDSDLPANFVDLAVNYYNWLYCKNAPGGSGYYTDLEDFQSLYALDDTEIIFLKKIALAYVAGFPEEKIENRGNIAQDEERFRNFVRNIRTEFYHRKGNENSYRYFFKTLYGVTGFGASGSDIGIDYPKKYIMRLNGGRFSGLGSLENGSTGSYEEISSLGGSYLNRSVLRDGWWYQDYSYLIKVGRDDDQYSDILLNVLHPAGLKPFFEKTIDDYVPIGGSTSDFDPYSTLPVLENYFGYYMGTTVDLDACIGCSGASKTITHYGVGYTYNSPSHKHPAWAYIVPSGVTPDFGDLNILPFLELSPQNGGLTLNPNDGISACGDPGFSCLGV